MMLKKILKIIGLLALLTLLAGAGIFFYQNRQNPKEALETAEFRDFIPFNTNVFTIGDNENTDGTNGEDDPLTNGTNVEEFGTRSLRKIATGPISGFSIANRSFLKVEEASTENQTTTTKKTPVYEIKTVIQYMQKSNSYVYESPTDKINFAQTSNIVVPGSAEGFFTPDGDQAVSRYFDDRRNVIQSYWFEIPKPNTEGKLEQKQGKFLTENADNFAVSPDGKEFGLLIDRGTSASLLLTNRATGRSREVFTSPFTEWIISWTNQSAIFLTTKASGTTVGSSYKLTQSTGRLERMLFGISGLTVLPNPQNSKILYAQADTTLQTFVYTPKEKSTQTLGVRTLPEKCVWAKDGLIIYCAVPVFLDEGIYPDIWYKGVTSFNDRIWKIDTVTGTETIIMDPASVGGGSPIDGTHLKLDPLERTLFFMNKKDFSLWQLSL